MTPPRVTNDMAVLTAVNCCVYICEKKLQNYFILVDDLIILKSSHCFDHPNRVNELPYVITVRFQFFHAFRRQRIWYSRWTGCHSKRGQILDRLTFSADSIRIPRPAKRFYDFFFQRAEAQNFTAVRWWSWDTVPLSTAERVITLCTDHIQFILANILAATDDPDKQPLHWLVLTLLLTDEIYTTGDKNNNMRMMNVLCVIINFVHQRMW